MKTQCLFVILMTLFSTSAMAVMPSAFKDVGCGANDIRRDPLQMNRIPVSVPLGAPPRGPLEKLGPEYGLNEDQMAQLRRSTGEIWCKERVQVKVNGKTKTKTVTTQASATILGFDGQITTAAHKFAQGGRKRDMIGCEFRNKEQPPQIAELDLDDMFLGTLDPDVDKGNDIAHVRLKTSIRDAKPIMVDVSGDDLAVGDELYAVTGREEDFKSSGDAILRKVTVNRLSKKVPSLVFIFGAVNGGGSGGMNYYVNEKNEIVAKAMFVRADELSKNNTEYNDKSNDEVEDNYNLSLVLDAQRLKDLAIFGQGRPMKTANTSPKDKGA